MIKLPYILFFLIISASCFSVIVEYKWEPSAPEYHVEISSNAGFYFPVVDDTIQTTNYIVDLPPGHYYIRIAPVLQGVEGLFSDPVDFIVSEDAAGGGKLKNINPPSSYEEESAGSSNTLSWNCVISTNSPMNSSSSLYYALDSPQDFKKARGLRVRIDTSPLEEGRHTLFYRLVNPLGRESRISSVMFSVDHSPPAIDVTPDEFKIYGEKTYLYPGSRINFSCQDKWSSFTSYFGVNGRRIDEPFYTVTRDTNVLKVICFAVNEMNNESRLVRTFYVDNEPPQIALYLNKKEVIHAMKAEGDNIINIRISDNTSVLQFFTILDEITNKNMPMSLRYLKNGQHAFKIIAEDIFDNSSQKSYRIDVSEDRSIVGWMVYPSKD